MSFKRIFRAGVPTDDKGEFDVMLLPVAENDSTFIGFHAATETKDSKMIVAGELYEVGIAPLAGEDKQVITKEHKMHVAWGVFWWLWGAMMVVTMLLDPIIPNTFWFYAFAIFIAPEAIGAAIAASKGTTFSESLWTLSQHGLALRLFSCGVGNAVGVKTWSLYFIISEMAGKEIIWWEKLPWDIAMVGLNVWLFMHFLHTGKKG